MASVSIVWATSARGRCLATVVKRVAALAAVSGAPSVVVARRGGGAQHASRGVLVLDLPGAALGAAMLAGARVAVGGRCLLADDDVALSHDGVAAHRRATAPSVGFLIGAPPAMSVLGTADAAVAFALARGRNACLPTGTLAALDAGALDDPARAMCLARGVACLRLAPEASARWCGNAMSARALGAWAAGLYESAPATLAAGGVGAFRRVAYHRLLLRRALLAGPPLLAMIASVAPRPWGTAIRSAGEDAFYWRGVGATLGSDRMRRLRGGTTILMLHAFGEPASRFVLPRSRLQRRLVVLRLMRRRPLGLDDYVSMRQAYELPPLRATVLTVDDGYEDVYAIAAPLLARQGWPATVFIVSRRVAQANDWDDAAPLGGRPLAGWDVIRAGTRSGIGVGAHSQTHAALTKLDGRGLVEEVEGSGEDIAAALGHAVSCFAYPYGDEDVQTRHAVVVAGFTAACSAREGVNDAYESLDSLRRVEIRGDDRLWRFVLAVALGRRWP